MSLRGGFHPFLVGRADEAISTWRNDEIATPSTPIEEKDAGLAMTELGGFVAMAVTGIVLAGCSRPPEPAPEAPVHNVVTNYVDSRLNDLRMSEAAAHRAETIAQRQQAQMQDVSRQTGDAGQP